MAAAADVAGYADITLEQAAQWLDRTGKEALGEGRALERALRVVGNLISVIDGGKGGGSDAA